MRSPVAGPITLSGSDAETMVIMLFLHGTTIMHRGGVGRSRSDRVQQVRENEGSVSDFATYVPIGESAQKARAWHDQGAEIVYLSAHTKAGDIDHDRSILQRYGFPEGRICFRRLPEGYADVAERVMPDVLIEDDCESIGGAAAMTYPHVSAAGRGAIQHIVVREFEGIDHLPDDLAGLKAYAGR